MQPPIRFAKDMLWPLIFTGAMIWVIWYFPRFIVAMGKANDNLNSKYQTAGLIDYLFALVAIVALVMGVASARSTKGEIELRSKFDKFALFLCRVTMLLLLGVVGVMFFEVVARYVFEKPTLWANEMSLWLAGFIYLLAGVYAMQQRSHISIFLVYDQMPRWLQRGCDVLSTTLIFLFAFFIFWGGWTEASEKFMRWETFGTAFDPPLPATMKIMVIFTAFMVAVQAIANLIVDWSRGPESHGVVDESEIEEMIESAQHQFDQSKRS
ncbi:TRAP transporter small permease subunit [Paracoccus tegillarcae]|uniref:TRAP transporter small permease protein n=1 Tax=Paracoccus tegillarcae TaxID=1529068 RepID=A0A2K9ERS2_9RHOB|nr:TRAP transporter small permease [Paracoccus tegillarcae]AUH33496.1 hypothetical protein CUV01_08935 [Paracoccus tegillarcae]